MTMIVGGVGGASVFSSASGGKLYAYNALDDTTPTQVAPINTQRQRITFHNPGDVDVFVYPAFKVNTGTAVANAPTVAAPGGSFRVFANGGALTIEGSENSLAWYALAASGSGKPLTVMDSNL